MTTNINTIILSTIAVAHAPTTSQIVEQTGLDPHLVGRTGDVDGDHSHASIAFRMVIAVA